MDLRETEVLPLDVYELLCIMSSIDKNNKKT